MAVLPIKRVVAWSRTEATARRFVDRVKERYGDIDVDIVSSPRDVAAASDVLCTLTPAREPVVLGDWFKPGLHINAVGAPPRPDHREIDSAGMARAKVFVDSMATAQKKSGDLLLAIADGSIDESHVCGELGDVITGAKIGRSVAGDITLFNSVGLAVQDLALGALLVHAARAKGVGQEVDLSR